MKRYWIPAILILASCGIFKKENSEEVETTKSEGYSALQLEHFDHSVNPADDIYDFVNGLWMKKTEIPADRGRWGSFDELRKKADAQTFTVLEDAIKGGKYGPETPQGKAVIIYKGYLDTTKRNADGIGPLIPYLEEISALSSVEDIDVYSKKYMDQGGNPMIGFGIIFTIGFIANFGSISYLFKQFEPPYEEVQEVEKNINLNEKQFLNIKKFITYDSLSEFSFNISGPLMMVFWLREQNFNYIELAILINVSQVLGLFSLRYWGKQIDKLGTFTTIRWTSFTIAIFPLFWVLTYFLPNELKLPASLVIASLASLMFSGRALAMDNRLFEHMRGKNMIKLSSKRVFYRGIFIFLGGVLGGLLTKYDFQIFSGVIERLTPIHVVFIFSSLIRMSIWFFYLRSNHRSI